MAHTADVFLSHNWGVDNSGRDNHFRVSLINKELQDIGYKTWFDGDRMKGDLFKQMSQGIENTQSVIVFITQKYIDKVDGDNAGDNCKNEFNYAAIKKTSSNMVAVLMEREMRDTRKWTGPVGLHLSTKMYIDMSGDLKKKTYLSQQMNLLKEELQFMGIHPTNSNDINMPATPGTCFFNFLFKIRVKFNCVFHLAKYFMTHSK